MSEVEVFVPLFHSKLPCVPDPMFPQFLICSLFQLIHLLTTSPHRLTQHLIVPTFPKTGWLMFPCSLRYFPFVSFIPKYPGRPSVTAFPILRKKVQQISILYRRCEKSFQIFYGGNSTFINSFDKTKF